MVANTVLQRSNLFNRLSIDKRKFNNWVNRIEEGYSPHNFYHNALHAADTTVVMNFFMTRYRFRGKNVGESQTISNSNKEVPLTQAQSNSKISARSSRNTEIDSIYRLSNEEVFSGLVAAMIHDFRHPGFTNAFLINTMNPIALRYNDQAILEHYHAASAFELMAEDQNCNILSHMTVEKRKLIRDAIISMVLGTDMASHFEYIGRFKNKLLTQNGLEWDKPADRKILLVMMMKASDINNITKPTELSVKWTDMYTAEVFRQGDEERRLGLPVSPFMNRENHDQAKSQIVSTTEYSIS